MTREFPKGVPQYFFDDEWIADQRRLVRRWLPASVHPDPVIRPDRPWEGRCLFMYGSVLPDGGGGYRLYYTNWEPGFGHRAVMVASSRDGLSWEKPELGLVEWKGSRANNIAIQPTGPMDSPSFIHDPADAAWPYKMVCYQHVGEPTGDGAGMFTWRSTDGLRWEPAAGCRLGMGDRNSFRRDSRSGLYVLLTRSWAHWPAAGARHLARSESADFVNWSEPELVLKPDLADEPDVEFYGMPVFERNGWYLGLLEYWDSARDVIEVHLALSRDGREWRRPGPRVPFIGAEYPWNRGWNTCANNGPILLKEQMVFYFGGRWQAHGWDTARHHGVVGCASLPLDRFCALEGAGGGSFETATLTWPGGDLLLNADTRESFDSHPGMCNGRIGVEVLDAEGKGLPEWSGDQKATFVGNTHCRGAIHNRSVRWSGDRGLGALSGQALRFRFHLQHARLFTVEAAG